MNKFTAKQTQEIKALKHNEFKRLNIYDGSVRSGKTWISCVIWALWVASRKQEGKFLMCAKTLTALKRNVLDVLIDIFGSDNISYSINQKKAYIFDKEVELEGANNALSEGKIRGMTLLGAYCDELTLFPEDFFKMLLTRLSVKNAKLFATTNPDTPNHWLYTDYFHPEEDNGIDLRRITFLLDDNTTLDPNYATNLKKEFSGVFYDRYIKGLWVAAEGLVYSNFSKDLHVVKTQPRNYIKYQISMDYGTFNPFCALLWGYCDGIWYCVKEYWYCGRDKGVQKDDGQYYNDLCKFIGDLQIDRILVDPSASSFITHARHRGKYAVIHAKNSVSDGIQSVQMALNNGLIKINDCCEKSIKEFKLYSWNEKSEEDEPVKENDHAMDACRYFVFTNRIAIPNR